MLRLLGYGFAGFLTSGLGRAIAACPMLFVVILLVIGGGLYFDSGSFAYAIQSILLLSFGLGVVLILTGNVAGFAVVIPLILLDQWTGMLTPKWLDDQQATSVPVVPAVPDVWSHVWAYLTSTHMLIFIGVITALILGQMVWKGMHYRPNPMDAYVRPTYRD